LVGTYECLHPLGKIRAAGLVPTSACIRSEKYERISWYLRVPASARKIFCGPIGSNGIPLWAFTASNDWYQQQPQQGGVLVPTAASKGRTGTNSSLKREDWYQQQLIPFPASQEGSTRNDDWYRSPALLVDWFQRSYFGGDLRH
jgi:hypothetical protein